MKYESIKIYESGLMVTFELGNSIRSEPKLQVRIIPFGTNGISFEIIVTGELIAYLDDSGAVLNQSGTPYAATFVDLKNALSVFF